MAVNIMFIVIRSISSTYYTVARVCVYAKPSAGCVVVLHICVNVVKYLGYIIVYDRYLC